MENSAFLSLAKLKQFFFKKHNLILNLTKTNYMEFSTKNSKNKFNPNIKIDQNVIAKVDEIKFLGLTLDSSLTVHTSIPT